MKAITVRAPFSWAITTGAKTVENRGRNCTYRGPIAIHTSRTWDDTGAYDDRIQQLYAGTGKYDPAVPVPEQPFRAQMGAIVAVADLVDVHPARRTDDILSACCPPWGELWHHGPSGRRCLAHHLVLANIRALPWGRQVPAAGKVFFPWTPDPALVVAIEREVATCSI